MVEMSEDALVRQRGFAQQSVGAAARHPSADAVIKLRDLLAKHIVTLPLPDYQEGDGKVSRYDVGALARALSAGVVKLDQDLGAWQLGDTEKQGLTAQYLEGRLNQWCEALPHDKGPDSLRAKAEAAIKDAKSTGLFDSQREAYIRKGGKEENYQLLESLRELVGLHLSHLMGIQNPSTGSTKGIAISEDEGESLTRRITSNWDIMRTINTLLLAEPADAKVLHGKLDALVQFVEQHPVPPMSQLLRSTDKDNLQHLDKVPFLDRLKDAVSQIKNPLVFQALGHSLGRTGRP